MTDGMKDMWFGFLLIVFVITGITGTVWWAFYKYKDCRRVGHTQTYCLVDQFMG